MAQAKEEVKSKGDLKWEAFSNKKPSKIYELQLVQQKQLRYVRDNKKWVIFEGDLSEIPPSKDNNDRLYYRHMNQKQFDYLLQNSKVDMVDAKAYVTITTSHKYCLKYFNNKKRNGTDNTHVVEFIIDDDVNLEQLFKLEANKQLNILNLQPKIEDEAFSWGLGPQCRKGVLGKVFNELMAKNKIKHRLVNWKMKNKYKK
eukprot:353656_1